MTSNPHRLLCLYPWMELGGSDKFNLDLLAQLSARGWRISVATTTPSRHPWRAAFARHCEAIHDLGNGRDPAELPARLLAILRGQPFDCVLISHCSVGYRLLPYMQAHAPRPAYLDYCHIVEGDGHHVRASLEHSTWLDRQIVSSHQVREWMLARGGDPQRIAVCTTNVDTRLWDPARYDRAALRAELGIAPAAPVVLYAARLERQKQPMLAFQVMRALARRLPETVFLVAGDGRFAGYLRGATRLHHLERQIRLLGPVDNQRVRELLAASDILFLPSEMEGISLAVYEAMAMGVAPVSAAVGGQAELVTPECGVLVERGPGERERYIAALLELLRDPQRLRALGAGARARVAAEFPLDAMGQRMDALLTQASQHQAAHSRPPVGQDAALASARAAVATARAEWAVYTPAQRRAPLPVRLKRRAWQALNGPAWWLLPLSERARSHL